MIKVKGNNRPHKKKVRTIALSILLAVIVWFMVTALTDPDITVTVSNLDVRFTGESALREKELAATGKGSVPQLSVVVTGKRSDLMSGMDGMYVQVDLSGIDSEGVYSLPGAISLPSTRIKVEKEKYGDIPVTVEKLTSKEIEVSVKQTGSVKDKLIESKATDPKVTITGAKSETDKVSGAVATVDISGVTKDGIVRANYLLTDESGALIDENETLETTRPDVEIENKVYNAVSLPVSVSLTDELKKNYILKTDGTTVAPASVVVGVRDESPESVAVLIDKVDGGETEYETVDTDSIYIPPESARVKVKPDIVRKESRTLELSVAAENAPQNMPVSIDGNVTALITGEEGKVNADTVRASVDLSGLSSGTYTLPVKFSGDNVSADREYTVGVTIG